MAFARLASFSLAATMAILLSPLRGLAQQGPSFRNELMPEPASLHVGTGDFILQPGLTIALTETQSPRLQNAVLRTIKRLENKTGVALAAKFVPGNPAMLTLAVKSEGGAVQDLDEDESYTLVTTASTLRVEAATTTGALHALETLQQLVQAAGNQYVIPSVTVQDAPRFRWRGLMIDCGRHFEPLNVLKRNLDAMAAVKLNVFHWHLTEDQGFRIESKAFPRLTEAGSDGLFYTQQEARDLVAYARDRGIRVVPEFEMPGHSTAWLVAYPELASGTVPTEIRREFGVSDFAIDPTREETYTFIATFLREMTTIFPDRYVHIGGDEAPAPDWKRNPRILAFMKAHQLSDNEALQAYFNQRVLAILTRLNRRMVGWDEIFNPALPKDVVVQSWRGEAALAKGAQGGYQGVLSAPYYLDGMKPAGVHYLSDPVPANTTLTPEQQKLILGGEVCMWGEQLDQHTIDSRIWPRTAAIAERFWSPQSLVDVDDMYRRLQVLSVDLESRGLQHLTSEDAGLRDLVQSQDIDALRTVALAFEPVSFGERYQAQHTSQLTPLTNFVDAVRPDPPIRHDLELATRTFLADPHATSPSASRARQTLQTFYSSVALAVPEVQQEMATSPRLQPLAERIEQLSKLTSIAQDALRSLSTGAALPSDWKTQSLALIETAKKPSAMVRFTFLDSLTNLVSAAR